MFIEQHEVPRILDFDQGRWRPLDSDDLERNRRALGLAHPEQADWHSSAAVPKSADDLALVEDAGWRGPTRDRDRPLPEPGETLVSTRDGRLALGYVEAPYSVQAFKE